MTTVNPGCGETGGSGNDSVSPLAYTEGRPCQVVGDGVYGSDEGTGGDMGMDKAEEPEDKPKVMRRPYTPHQAGSGGTHGNAHAIPQLVSTLRGGSRSGRTSCAWGSLQQDGYNLEHGFLLS